MVRVRWLLVAMLARCLFDIALALALRKSHGATCGSSLVEREQLDEDTKSRTLHAGANVHVAAGSAG